MHGLLFEHNVQYHYRLVIILWNYQDTTGYIHKFSMLSGHAWLCVGKIGRLIRNQAICTEIDQAQWIWSNRIIFGLFSCITKSIWLCTYTRMILLRRCLWILDSLRGTCWVKSCQWPVSRNHFAAFNIDGARGFRSSYFNLGHQDKQQVFRSVCKSNISIFYFVLASLLKQYFTLLYCPRDYI